ncbi:MAG: TolC family protein [Legionellales bacterium]|nr:TolC family protein [Legionellales bacterium]
MQKPTQIVAPKSTRSGTKIVAQQPSVHQAAWWKKMHDPELDHLIALALAKNNALQSASANILQAQAQLQEARFAWLPTLQATGNGFVGGGWDSHYHPEGSLAAIPGLSKVGSIHFRGYFGGFVPKYSLNILENIYQNSYATESLAMQEAMYQSTRISIISQVSGAYFMLLGQRAQLNDQRQYLQDLKKIRQLEGSRYRHGASDATIITDLDRQIESDTTNLSSLENSIAQVENAIQILLDRNPGPLAQYGDVNHLPVKGLIPANISSEVLKKRPDILSAEHNLNMAEAKVGVAYANFFPMLSLTDLVGSSSIEMIHLLKLSTSLWVLQGAASLPLLNGVSYAQIKEAKAGYLAAYYNYAQTLRSAFADVDNSLTNQQIMYAIYQRQSKALQSAQKSYSLALARYKAGAKDYRDVLNAKLLVDSAKLNVTLAKMQQLDSIVEVYQSLAM